MSDIVWLYLAAMVAGAFVCMGAPKARWRHIGALVTTVAFIAFCIASPDAQAHRTESQQQAQTWVYNLWQSHCGNGSTWWCANRKSTLWATPIGYHSWSVDYRWTEVHVFDSRGCGVVARVEHGAVVEVLTPEHCWG